jgi:tRNA nucleotidyltransferase (CCA-adding enzyme)
MGFMRDPSEDLFKTYKKENEAKNYYIKQMICQVCHELACQIHNKQQDLFYGYKLKVEQAKICKCFD